MKKLAKALWIEKNEGVYIVGPTAELQDDVGTVGFVEFSKNEKFSFFFNVYVVLLNCQKERYIAQLKVSDLFTRVKQFNLNSLRENEKIILVL